MAIESGKREGCMPVEGNNTIAPAHVLINVRNWSSRIKNIFLLKHIFATSTTCMAFSDLPCSNNTAFLHLICDELEPNESTSSSVHVSAFELCGVENVGRRVFSV